MRVDRHATVEQLIDVLLALVRHCAARFRRRFANADAPVLALVDELEFARWHRAAKRPSTAIEDLDAFFDLDQFPDEGFHA